MPSKHRNTKTMTLRLSPEESKRLNLAAARTGEGIADYVRACLLEESVHIYGTVAVLAAM